MDVIAIVGGGPAAYLPDLTQFEQEVSMWIGADRGALSLIEQDINPDIAIGDFDSIETQEKTKIQSKAGLFLEYQVEKDETDLELALLQAMDQKPDRILLFGVTGGRLDHELANLQLLYLLKQKEIEGVVIDNNNEVKLAFPGFHVVEKIKEFPYVSFLPMSMQVNGITLERFHYPLHNASIQWGSTLCISNKIDGKQGFLEFTNGILYIVQSRDPLGKG